MIIRQQNNLAGDDYSALEAEFDEKFVRFVAEDKILTPEEIQALPPAERAVAFEKHMEHRLGLFLIENSEKNNRLREVRIQAMAKAGLDYIGRFPNLTFEFREKVGRPPQPANPAAQLLEEEMMASKAKLDLKDVELTIESDDTNDPETLADAFARMIATLPRSRQLEYDARQDLTIIAPANPVVLDISGRLAPLTNPAEYSAAVHRGWPTFDRRNRPI